MANRKMSSRMQQKTDTSANWSQAITFCPLAGEIIVYSDLNKMKIGDGVTTVVNLPFVVDDDKLDKDFTNFYNFSGTWTAGTFSSAGNWAGIAYGNDIFLAVKSNTNVAAWSRDGITWNEVTMPLSNNWNTVCFGNGVFVVTGEGNYNACVTADGKTWQSTTSCSNLFCCSYGNGYFIGSPWGGSTFYRSKDGLNWEAVTVPRNAHWQTMKWCDNVWIAACSEQTYGLYSHDGITWTEMTMPASEDWQCFGYINGAYLCFAHQNSNYAYSTDAINWELKTSSAFSAGNGFFYTATGAGRCVLISGYHSHTATYYSTDGINWTQTPFTSAVTWWHVAYGDNKFVATAKSSTNISNYMLASTSSDIMDRKIEKGSLAQVATSGSYKDLRNKPTSVTSTMSASGWSSNTYSFESTYPVASYNIDIELAPTATAAQGKAYGKAMITGSATTNIVTAIGTVPTVDIPIIITVEEK